MPIVDVVPPANIRVVSTSSQAGTSVKWRIQCYVKSIETHKYVSAITKVIPWYEEFLEIFILWLVVPLRQQPYKFYF
jgi:hypothetical protein